MNLEKFIKNVEQTLDSSEIITDKEEINNYSIDRTKDFTPNGSLLLFPRTTEQIKEILILANQYKVPIVPSGGRTGYAGGAVASNQEVILSLKKMNKILDFDFTLPSVECEAGVITKNLQNEVQKQGYYFPIDFSSSGSSMIGGNIATNAGGIRVIRYGPLRNWVLGLEVVTGKGEILNFTGKIIKNNTGYELKQLFIGSEGTLGIITKATFLLTQTPKETILYLFAFVDFEKVIQSLELTKQRFDNILCFEVFDHSCLNLVCKKHSLNYPFESLREKDCWYILLEIERPENYSDIPYEDFLNQLYELGMIDCIFSEKESIKKNLFRYREDISEAVAMSGKFHKNDISLPIKNMNLFINKIKELVFNKYKEFQIFFFGHLGDGNIHINLLTDRDYDSQLFLKKTKEFDQELYEMIFNFQGSISAEHGIGLLKKKYLHFSRSKEEIEYMKAIKKIFDPNNILNPGKIFDV